MATTRASVVASGPTPGRSWWRTLRHHLGRLGVHTVGPLQRCAQTCYTDDNDGAPRPQSGRSTAFHRPLPATTRTKGTGRKDRAFLVATKDLAKVRAGKIGALKRWGPPRIVRLDELTAEQARLVRALVDAARSAESEPAA